ncbi:MFS transporter [Rhodovulum sp. DZ06]|uniref:MFS transporter n=1 Tax=Rhodovulum sp. DZ06 TaxID=3425126 RepID=UPI003D33AFAD
MTTMDDLSGAQRASVKRWQWGMLALGLTCELFLAADWYGVAAALPFLAPELGLSEAQAGLAQGIFALTYGLGMLVWSALSRDWSAKKMLIVGLFGVGVGMVLQVFVQNFTQLLVLRLVIGFFDAGVFIGVMKLLLAWFPPARRGLIVGLILAACSLAITLDFSLGIPLTIAYGWRVFFAALAVGTLVAGALVVAFARPGPAALGIEGFRWKGETAETGEVSLAAIFRTRWVYVGGFAIAACTFAIAGTATWVVPAFITLQGMPESSAALIGTLMGLSQVVFLVIGGRMADAGDKLRLIRVSTVIAVGVALMFWVATVEPLPFAMLVLMAALSGAAVLCGGAIFALMSEAYPAKLGPAAIGMAEVFGILSSFLAPTMMGIIIGGSGGFSAAFLAFAGVEALFLVALCALTLRRVSPAAEGEPEAAAA